jgi:hypothetical protein
MLSYETLRSAIGVLNPEMKKIPRHHALKANYSITLGLLFLINRISCLTGPFAMNPFATSPQEISLLLFV